MTRTEPWSIVAVLGFTIACGAGLASVVCGPAYRLDLLPLDAAFTLLRWSVYGALGAIAVSMLGLLLARPGRGRRGFVLALLGALLGLLVFWVPYDQYRTARTVPAIHDISTDTVDPPRFSAIVELRADAPNSHTYGGPSVASKQQAAYPDIQPILFSRPADEVFEAALQTARDLDWDLASVAVDAGLIEATDTTVWFGFKDDVVVRIRPGSGTTVVDVRSVSRVGRSDLGKNAQRVRMFIAELRKRIE